jgi:hypothetical protein
MLSDSIDCLVVAESSNGHAAAPTGISGVFPGISQYFPTAGVNNLHVKMPARFGSTTTLMATCPRCLGALTDNHKCPKGALSRVSDAISTVGLGAVIGVVLCYVVEERPAGALVLAAAALGAVLASAVRQAVGGRP